MASVAELIDLAESLPLRQLEKLLRVAQALAEGIETTVAADSDLLSSAFVNDFSDSLLVYHATHTQRLTKKAFEFAFRDASEAAGREATITSNQVNPGADVLVDGVKYSLKTEGAQGISSLTVTISKLMEAAWIRDCVTGEDFAREASRRIAEHLGSYDRILVLRSFAEIGGDVRYDLVEIPVAVLLNVRGLSAADFKPRSGRGSTSAVVVLDGAAAFTLTLDGSVEKVTIRNLRLDLCQVHGTWRIRPPARASRP
ncbi:MAG: hypothetical protein DCC49_09200 [Acidobacteria bacterium]|nr:MAG: hypothetical protein DCC49_09200 [Acidobacteriota bacterium]